MSFVNIALVVFAIWLLAITIGLMYVFPFLSKFKKSSKDGDLREVLEKLLNDGEKNRNLLSQIIDNAERLEKEGQTHVQKIGFIRFNPFEETGGDHSFSLALLDGNISGVVLTCLHARERTRIYVKPISHGKSELTLSNEEKKAIEKAQKI